jgi:hypothetical protein
MITEEEKRRISAAATISASADAFTIEGAVVRHPRIAVATLSCPTIAVARKFVPSLFLFHRSQSCPPPLHSGEAYFK